MKLYHSGYDVIKSPDLKHGRKNADFGQGFYLSPDEEFSRKWAMPRTGRECIINTYELDETNLRIKTLKRDETWFGFILENRRYARDLYEEYDVIIGPVANDTIYDTLGITSGNWLSNEELLAILSAGPLYTQAVIKSEEAKKHLSFLSHEVLDPEAVREKRKSVRAEEEEFQKAMAEILK